MRKLVPLTTAYLIIAASALAQAPASPGTGSPTGSSNGAVNARSTIMVAPSALEKGSNSFTESEALGRLERAGISKVTEFKKDDQGIWRGKGLHDGKSVSLGLDYKGNISAQ